MSSAQNDGPAESKIFDLARSDHGDGFNPARPRLIRYSPQELLAIKETAVISENESLQFADVAFEENLLRQRLYQGDENLGAESMGVRVQAIMTQTQNLRNRFQQAPQAFAPPLNDRSNYILAAPMKRKSRNDIVARFLEEHSKPLNKIVTSDGDVVDMFLGAENGEVSLFLRSLYNMPLPDSRILNRAITEIDNERGRILVMRYQMTAALRIYPPGIVRTSMEMALGNMETREMLLRRRHKELVDELNRLQHDLEIQKQQANDLEQVKIERDRSKRETALEQMKQKLERYQERLRRCEEYRDVSCAELLEDGREGKDAELRRECYLHWEREAKHIRALTHDLIALLNSFAGRTIASQDEMVGDVRPIRSSLQRRSSKLAQMQRSLPLSCVANPKSLGFGNNGRLRCGAKSPPRHDPVSILSADSESWAWGPMYGPHPVNEADQG